MAKKKVGICDFETTLHSPVSVWLAGVKDLQDDNKDITQKCGSGNQASLP